jgi:hypothetical protein
MRTTALSSTTNPSSQSKNEPFVRRRRIELEPAVFALTVVALVMSISLWSPLPKAQHMVPGDASTSVSQAPRS